MARKTQEVMLKFPKKGVNVDVAQTEQPPDTCVDCANVRVHDSLEDRERGGMRPGLSRYVNAQMSGTNRVQDINYAVVIGNSSPAANTLSYRTVRPMAISNGVVVTFNTTTVTNATAGGARTLSNTVPFIFSTELFQRIYITDGTSYKIWIAANNTLSDWTPTAGSLPGTDGTVTPRLIEMWRSRIVLAGLRTDPHNWFMSKLGDPLDWDYAPATSIETQAVQGGVGVVGKAPDVINAILPYSDDVLIFGCDHSLYQLAGDPMAGGRVDQLSGTVGMAFGRPYCQDATGKVYFFSSRGSVYTMIGGGGSPISISEKSIDSIFTDVNLNTTYVRMVWDEDQAGAHLFFTPFTAGNTDHWFFDARTGGWFRDRFANTDLDPTASRVFDGDAPGDRILLLGGRDGYIRYYNTDAVTDDTVAIGSFVIIGPTVAEEGKRPFILTELQAHTDPDGNAIKYEILSGDTPGAALATASSAFTADGDWIAGMGTVTNPRVRAYYLYYKIGSNTATLQWSLERVRSKIQIIDTSHGRSRGKDFSFTTRGDHTSTLTDYKFYMPVSRANDNSKAYLFYGGTLRNEESTLGNAVLLGGSLASNTIASDALGTGTTGTHIYLRSGTNDIAYFAYPWRGTFFGSTYGASIDTIFPTWSTTNWSSEIAFYVEPSTYNDVDNNARQVSPFYFNLFGNVFSSSTGPYHRSSSNSTFSVRNLSNTVINTDTIVDFTTVGWHRMFFKFSGNTLNMWHNTTPVTHSGNTSFVGDYDLVSDANDAMASIASGSTGLYRLEYHIKFFRFWNPDLAGGDLLGAINSSFPDQNTSVYV